MADLQGPVCPNDVFQAVFESRDLTATGELPSGYRRCDCGRAYSVDRGCHCWRSMDRDVELGKAYARLPRRFDWANVGSPLFVERVHPTLVKTAETWEPYDGGNLVMLGANETGKTAVAVALVRRLLDRARTSSEAECFCAATITFVTALELAAASRRADWDSVNAARVASLLVLDELGFEQHDPKRDSGLLELFDYRYAESLPTVLTSSMTRQQLERRYGAALVRRLVDGATVLSVSGEGRRS